MTAIELAETPVRTRVASTRMRDVLYGEWIKLRSVRSTMWTLVALVGFGAGMTVLLCATSADAIASGEAGDPPEAFITGGMVIAQVTAVVLGALAVSSEYSTGTIRTTLAATPRRGQVMLAKCALIAVVLLVVGTVTAFLGYFAANPFLDAQGVGVPLGGEGVVRAMIGSGMSLAGMGLFAAAFAFLVRHTAAALTLSLALIFVVGNLAMLVPGDVGEWVTKLMPGNAGANISFVVNFDPTALGPWEGFGVFCVEIATLLALAAVRFVRRDA